MRLTLFKMPKPQRFNMYPRYYDEQKEELQQRIRDAEIKRDRSERIRQEIEAGTYRPEFSGRIKSQFGQSTSLRQQQRSSNVRLLIILGALLVISYYMFFA